MLEFLGWDIPAAIKVLASQHPGFQHGGSFMVPGSGAADSRFVGFRATPGEVVSISTPIQAGRDTAILTNIHKEVARSNATSTHLQGQMLDELRRLREEQATMRIRLDRLVNAPRATG